METGKLRRGGKQAQRHKKQLYENLKPLVLAHAPSMGNTLLEGNDINDDDTRSESVASKKGRNYA